MHFRSILNVLAALSTLLGLTMLFAAGWSYFYNESDLKGILLSSAITLSVNLPIWFLTRGKINLSIKDGFAIVTLVWISTALFSALPFIMTGAIPNITDAFFEAMSGVTTTGASILGNSETILIRLQNESNEESMETIARCIGQIVVGEEVYSEGDMTTEEITEWVEDLTTEQFANILEFFKTMPKLKHSITLKNKKTETNFTVVLEGLADFF